MKNNFWKKAGWLALMVLPVVASLVGQIAIGVLVVILSALSTVLSGLGGGLTPEQIQQTILEQSMDGIVFSILVYHVLALLAFGLWYYFGCGRPKPVSPGKVFRGRVVLVTVVMGLLMCIGANALLGAAEYLVPRMIEEYSEMMEMAGIGVNLFAIIASVLIAPIGEEILCRGLTFHYAGKVVEGMKNEKAAFWTANCLQALMFGIMHGNLVQGSYAFLLGLCLGWLRHRYNSLYPAMLAHFVVNFASSFVMGYLFMALPNLFVVYVGILAVSVAAILMLMRHEEKCER